jgi:hypothetical protein
MGTTVMAEVEAMFLLAWFKRLNLGVAQLEIRSYSQKCQIYVVS